MNEVSLHEDSTYIYQDALSLSVQPFNAGRPEAVLLVRASQSTGHGHRTNISAGFDLTADSAVALAAALMRHATQLRIAAKGLTVQEYAAGQL